MRFRKQHIATLLASFAFDEWIDLPERRKIRSETAFLMMLLRFGKGLDLDTIGREWFRYGAAHVSYAINWITVELLYLLGNYLRLLHF